MFGGASQVCRLMQGLGAQGVANVLVCPPGDVPAAASGAAETIVLPMGGDFDFGFARRLRVLFGRVRPDIVHVHSRRGADLFAGLACVAERLPAVLTRRVDNPEPAFWARFKYRPYRAIIAISRAVEAELTVNVGLARSRVRRIPSAVDTREFRPDPCARGRLLAELTLPGNAFVVGVCAQLIERKGHDVLLACVPELVRRHPELRVLCFGRGPLERRLRRAIASRGLDAQVHVAGFRRDMPALVPGLDVLVHPARREGLGVALLEAMSCAVPVVASAVGGIVDVVETGVEGLLVTPDNVAELGAALERIIGDARLRKRMGAAGRLRAKRDFSIGLMTERYLDVYREILAGGHAAV